MWKLTSRTAVAFRPFASSWSSVMSLHKRGGIFHYDFAVDGRRYRGTTKEKTRIESAMIEAALINDAKQRKLDVRRREARPWRSFPTAFSTGSKRPVWNLSRRIITGADGRCLRRPRLRPCGFPTSRPTRRVRSASLIRRPIATERCARCAGCWQSRRMGTDCRAPRVKLLKKRAVCSHRQRHAGEAACSGTTAAS